MILIDRSLEFQTIILTLDMVGNYSNLLLLHDATREEFSIDLIVNVSLFPARFDKFEVPTEDFQDMPEGYYCYEVKDSSNALIESGKLFIKPLAVAPTLTVPDSEDIIQVFTK